MRVNLGRQHVLDICLRFHMPLNIQISILVMSCKVQLPLNKRHRPLSLECDE